MRLHIVCSNHGVGNKIPTPFTYSVFGGMLNERQQQYDSYK